MDSNETEKLHAVVSALVGGERPGDTLIRLANLIMRVQKDTPHVVTADWKDWLRDIGKRLNTVARPIGTSMTEEPPQPTAGSELENWERVSERWMAVDEFLEWLCDVHGVCLAWATAEPGTPLNAATLFDEFFRVDRKKLDRERRELLELHRKQDTV